MLGPQRVDQLVSTDRTIRKGARSCLESSSILDPRSNIAVKWLLTWISPRLALRTVRHYQERSKDSHPFM